MNTHKTTGDFFAYNPYTISLNMEKIMTTKATNWDSNLNRIVDGLASLLLSLRKQPRIRMSAKSELAVGVCLYVCLLVYVLFMSVCSLLSLRKQE
jgi:hypothetical protein